MEPKRPDSDVGALQRRITELEAELSTTKTLLAATWPGKEVPTEPIPAELVHALHGPRQAVRLMIDGTPVFAGVRGRSGKPDAARELDVWSAVLQFAREGK